MALYERSLAEHQFSPRDYGFFQAQMAASLALSGDPDDAATVAMAAARRASEADSPRTTRELMRVVDVLRPWAQRPAVRELNAVLTDH